MSLLSKVAGLINARAETEPVASDAYSSLYSALPE